MEDNKYEKFQKAGNSNQQNFCFSKKVKAGKRTYFIDVKETRDRDYYIILTESQRRLDDDGFERHKIFLYKEDFNKVSEGLLEAINHVKTELMPDYNFDKFDNQEFDEYSENINLDNNEKDFYTA
jgi:hypothetical protein